MKFLSRFRRMLPALFSTLFLALVADPISAQDSFSNAYEGEDYPEFSAPAWYVFKANEPQPALDSGILRADLSESASLLYFMGTLDSGQTAGDGAWRAEASGTEVEFRFRGGADDMDKIFFQLDLTDGERRWTIRFLPGRIQAAGRDFSCETSEWETYRIRMEGETITMASSQLGEFVSQWPGSSITTGRNSLMFGTDSRIESTGSGKSFWELDFLRWSN